MNKKLASIILAISLVASLQLGITIFATADGDAEIALEQILDERGDVLDLSTQAESIEAEEPQPAEDVADPINEDTVIEESVGSVEGEAVDAAIVSEDDLAGEGSAVEDNGAVGASEEDAEEGDEVVATTPKASPAKAPKRAMSAMSASVNSEDTLRAAIENAPNGEETTIAITGDFTVSKTVNIPAGKKIVLTTTSGKAFTITANDYLFFVEQDASLSLSGDITLDGIKSCGLVKAEGVFTLNSGTLTRAREYAALAQGEKGLVIINGGTVTNCAKPAYQGGLVCAADGAHLIINGGAINNNSFNQNYGAPVALRNATGEMNGGTIEGNTMVQYQSGGGLAVFAVNHGTAKFVLNDGIISGNSAPRGGGVYVYGEYSSGANAYFEMNGGAITENEAPGIYNARTKYMGAGGGVYIEYNGHMVMNDGTISGNITNGDGGGVATNDEGKNEADMASFKMKNGVISGNTAYIHQSNTVQTGNGGGIYVRSQGVYIYQGIFADNVAETQGGGLYVSTQPYVMHMGPSSFYSNTAGLLGGGMWFCPEGNVTIALDDGAIFYQNTSNGAGDDFVNIEYGVQAPITLSDRALGGGLANWHVDGAVDRASLAQDKRGFPDLTAVRYADQSEAQRVPVTDIVNVSQMYALKSVTDEEAFQAGEHYATVHVYNNTAQRGGGLGSNGGVEIGTIEVPIELTVEKKWDIQDGSPVKPLQAITAYLVSAGHRIESVRLTPDVNGVYQGKFTNLPTNIPFTIEEDVPTGWSAAYSDVTEVDQFGNLEGTITNTPITATIKVSKTALFAGEPGELEGAQLSVVDEAGKVALDATNSAEVKWTTGEVKSFTLVPGSYTLQEDVAPAGYDKFEPIPFTVTAEGAVVDAEGNAIEDATITVNDPLTPREFAVSKVAVGGDEELEGAELTITGTDMNGNEIDAISWVSGGTPKQVTLPAGSYTLVENSAPAGYDVVNAIQFTIDAEGAILDAEGNAIENSTLVVEDPLSTHDVVVSKQDAISNAELPGAVLSITGTDANGVAISPITWTSGEEPKVVPLCAGSFTLTEVEVPEGYKQADPIDFVVTDEGKVLVAGEEVVDNKIVMLDQPEEEITPPEEPETPNTPNEEPPTEPETPNTPNEEPPTEPETPTPTPSKTVKANLPSPSSTAVSGPITGDALSSTVFGGLIALVVLGAAGTLASRRKAREARLANRKH